MMTLPSRPAFLGDLAQGSLQSLQDDAAAGALVTLQGVAQGLDSGDGVDGSGAAASDDAFLNGSLGGVQGVLDAQLLVLHLDLGRSADLDDSHAAGQLGQALLQLLAVRNRW